MERRHELPGSITGGRVEPISRGWVVKGHRTVSPWVAGGNRASEANLADLGVAWSTAFHGRSTRCPSAEILLKCSALSRCAGRPHATTRALDIALRASSVSSAIGTGSPEHDAPDGCRYLLPDSACAVHVRRRDEAAAARAARSCVVRANDDALMPRPA